MKNYLSVIFHDSILSLLTKKYGTSLNDSQKEDKADEMVRILHDQNAFICDQTQAIIDKKGINNYMATQVDGKPVFALTKEGMFHKIKVCYFITRTKEELTPEYLEKIYDELRCQANGENIFGSGDYKNS